LNFNKAVFKYFLRENCLFIEIKIPLFCIKMKRKAEKNLTPQIFDEIQQEGSAQAQDVVCLKLFCI